MHFLDVRGQILNADLRLSTRARQTPPPPPPPIPEESTPLPLPFCPGRLGSFPPGAGADPHPCRWSPPPRAETPPPPPHRHLRMFPHFTHTVVAVRLYTIFDKFLVRLSGRAMSVLHFNNFLQILPPVHDQWVPVTTAWRVLKLRIEEWSPIRRVGANKLNKQSRTADKGRSSSLGVGRGANNPSL